MAKIRFPKANSLRVICLEDYDELQSDDTRLYYDFDYLSLTNDCYFTKFSQDGNIWVQFRTDYANFNVYLIDYLTATEIDITSSVASGSVVANGTTQYELYFLTAAYSSYYYIRFDFDSDADKPVKTFRSEWFEVVTSTTDLLKFEWINSDFATYNDGIIWSQNQSIWINARISDLVVGVEKSVFTTENNKLKTTQAKPIKSKILEIELVPDYVLELLNIYCSMGKFYVNNVRYNIEGAIENADRQGDTRLYPIAMTLRMLTDHNGIGYEDYTDDAELTGDLPVIPAFAIYAGDGKAIYANTGKGLGYY